MTTKLLKTLALVTVLSLPLTTRSGEFRFPIGLTYSSGSYDAADTILDYYEDHYESMGDWDFDRFIIPVGLTFNPYYEFDFGLGVGLSIGPTSFIFIQESYEEWDYYGDYTSSDETYFSWAVPVGVDLRYTFFRDKKVSPYVRVGIRYPIVGGDNMEDSKPGAFGAVGVEFFRSKSVGFGFEVGYDSSEITVTGPDPGQEKDVTFSGFTAGVSVIF